MPPAGDSHAQRWLCSSYNPSAFPSPTDEADDYEYEYYDEYVQVEEKLSQEILLLGNLTGSTHPLSTEESSKVLLGAGGGRGRGEIPAPVCSAWQGSAASLPAERLLQRDEWGGLFAVFSFVFLL